MFNQDALIRLADALLEDPDSLWHLAVKKPLKAQHKLLLALLVTFPNAKEFGRPDGGYHWC